MQMLNLKPPISRLAIAALAGDHLEISASLRHKCRQLCDDWRSSTLPATRIPSVWLG
jgi:hypothetical protein